MTSNPRYSLITRWLHLGLMLGISAQLLLSTFMEKPRPGVTRGALESLGFRLHEIIGIGLLPLVIIWFLWLFIRRNEAGVRELFPWFNGVQRKAFWEAAKLAASEAVNRRVISDDEIRILVEAIHGLGALCALGMATSGTLVWLGMSADGVMTGWARWVLDFHQALATLMWAYIIGHGGMAVLHHGVGHDNLRNMFRLGRR